MRAHSSYPGEWGFHDLGSICLIQIGGTPSRDVLKYWAAPSDPTGLPWVSIGDLTTPWVEHTKERITEAGARNSNVKLVRKGTTLMSFKLSIGKMARAGSDLYTNEAIAAFEPQGDELDPNYLFHALPGVLGDLVVDQAVKGATLNKKKLAKISLPLPQRLEQGRIAEILDNVDEATAASGRELDKLARLREGMISERLGELERQLTPIVPLADLCRASGGSIQTGPFGSQLHAEDYKSEGTPIITVEHLGDGGILHTNLPLVGEPDRIRLQRYSLRVGDLVFSRVGAIDRCAMVGEAEDGWLFSGRLLRVRAASEQVNPAYLSLFLNSEQARRWIRNHAVGSTMACLNTKILSGTPVVLPDRNIQDGIVAAMAAIDDKVAKESLQITKLKLIKVGLSSDLLTGHVRTRPH